jgi:hypothetical protein
MQWKMKKNPTHVGGIDQVCELDWKAMKDIIDGILKPLVQRC